MDTLLRLLKLLRIIGLFPHKIDSRPNNVGHHEEERMQVQPSSDIGSLSPIYLSVAIIFQVIVSFLLCANALAEFIEDEMAEAGNAVDILGVILRKYVYALSCTIVNWIIISRHNKLARLYNSLSSIHTNFKGKANIDHISRYRRYIHAIMFLISLGQCITQTCTVGLTISDSLLWFKTIIEMFMFHLLIEYVLTYIALAYRRIVSSNGLIFIEENAPEFEEELKITEEISTLSNNYDNSFWTVVKRKEQDCGNNCLRCQHNSGSNCLRCLDTSGNYSSKCQHNSGKNSFRCETYLEATAMLLHLKDCVELAMKVFGYAIIMKMFQATLDNMANIYFTIHELKTKTLFENAFQMVYMLEYITKLFMYATLSEIINEQVRTNRYNVDIAIVCTYIINTQYSLL